MGHQVFRPGLGSCQRRFPVHCRAVTSQEGDVVPQEQCVRMVEFALGGSLNGGLGFSQAVEVQITERQIEIGGGKVGIQTDRLLRCFDRLLKLTGACSRESP